MVRPLCARVDGKMYAPYVHAWMGRCTPPMCTRGWEDVRPLCARVDGKMLCEGRVDVCGCSEMMSLDYLNS